MSTLTRNIALSALAAAGVALNLWLAQPTASVTAAPPTIAAPLVVAVAQPVQVPDRAPQGQPEGYTCTSPSSCAVLAAALGGTDEDPDPAHDYTRGNAPDEQPRAHSTQRRSSGAQHEDQPGWNCARQGNHVCGDGVAGGPTASGRCPAGGTRVHGTPHGCRYR